jgi:hypothetical protein
MKIFQQHGFYVVIASGWIDKVLGNGGIKSGFKYGFCFSACRQLGKPVCQQRIIVFFQVVAGGPYSFLVIISARSGNKPVPTVLIKYEALVDRMFIP